MSKVYLDYDQETLDAHYNLRAAVPDAIVHLGECARRSAVVRATRAHRFDVPYGPRHGERLNLFPAAKPGAPVLVFIHGGYWQRLDKNDFDYIAEPFVAAGAAVVNVDYTLIPDTTMDEIVRQARAAIAWAWREAASFNGDPARLHVAGHSAGGHLTMMAAMIEWDGFAPGLPRDLVKSATAISGVYDLEPVRLSSQNAGVGLDAAAARRNSPMLYIRKGLPSLALAVGAGETGDFIRQQRAFAAALAKAEVVAETLEIPGRHHFDVVHDLAEPASDLHALVRRRIGL
ncbi:MAG: alpha/beta hydrolase [Rhodospirillaceae bacterium]|nr:alpha/beta hydrolase [Rhodospirillaceae bacterium]